MSTAVVATAYGGPDVLAVIDEVLDAPEPGQVRVHIRAIGTNPVDFKRYRGDLGNDPHQLPMRLGGEAAGVVTDVAGEAEGPGGPIRAGDEVIVYPIEGAYASEVVVPAASVVPKPSILSFAEASGLMVAGVTAVHALTVTAVGAGDTVVLHGASGGVGLLAVQLAVGQGARVIATAALPGHDYLRKLGAEPVAYGDGLLERIRDLAPGGVDAAIDLVGTDEAVDSSVALVADRRRIATIVAFARGLDLGIRVLGGAPGADPGINIRNAARVELVRQAEAGQLSVLVAGDYPLSEAAVAHQELALGHTHGKIVLIP